MSHSAPLLPSAATCLSVAACPDTYAWGAYPPLRCLHACSGCFRLEPLRVGLAPTGKHRLSRRAPHRGGGSLSVEIGGDIHAAIVAGKLPYLARSILSPGHSGKIDRVQYVYGVLQLEL